MYKVIREVIESLYIDSLITRKLPRLPLAIVKRSYNYRTITDTATITLEGTQVFYKRYSYQHGSDWTYSWEIQGKEHVINVGRWGSFRGDAKEVRRMIKLITQYVKEYVK